MALSYSDLGRVDPTIIGEASQPTDLRMAVIDITQSAVADYVSSTGGLSVAASAFGLNSILYANGYRRGSTGDVDVSVVAVWDANLSGLKFLEHPAAGTDVAFTEVTSADFAVGDVIRCMAIGR